mgnify:CR=1 FL=1
MAKMSRRKKLVRVAKRKLLKPVLYAAGMSFVLYLAISNVVLQKKVFEDQVPRFLITRISRTFDETEFMHLLLTVQEIMKMPTASAELEEFANGAFPSPCPRFLEQQLKRMFQLALHRKLAGLARKAAERLAIVGDGKRKRHIVFDIIHIEHDTSFAREHDKQ